MVQYESSPGGEKVGDDEENVEQNRQQQILLGLLNMKMRRAKVDVQNVNIGGDGGYLSEVRWCV